ncbi:MAG: type 4a pilus biogenesis protein PilO [Spirochaetota bacterium]|nr:type 4a pilus biogenesis protein PilO [Spirochaetota bacterium]
MTDQPFIFAIIIILTIVGLAYFLIWPRYQAIDERKQILADIDSELKNAEAKLESFKEIKNRYEKEKSRIKELKQIMPMNEDIPGLLLNLDKLLITNGLATTGINFSISPSQAVKDKKAQNSDLPNILGINFGISGSYEGIKKFFGDIELNKRLMDIKSFNISSSNIKSKSSEGTETGSTAFNCSLSIDAYYSEFSQKLK